MERRLRIAQYGCGKMSAYTMRYAMEKGAEIVCAFGRSPHNLGKDIGDIAGVGKTGVLCGSGYQDVLWGNLITTLAGATHTSTRIIGKSSYNVEDYGLALAKVHRPWR